MDEQQPITITVYLCIARCYWGMQPYLCILWEPGDLVALDEKVQPPEQFQALEAVGEDLKLVTELGRRIREGDFKSILENIKVPEPPRGEMVRVTQGKIRTDERFNTGGRWVRPLSSDEASIRLRTRE